MTGEPGCTTTFTLLGPADVDGVACLQVRSESRLTGVERQTTSRGHFWVNQANGAVWMSSHKLSGVRFGSKQIDVTLVFEPTDAAMFEKGQ
jgi:hypothetical protein